MIPPRQQPQHAGSIGSVARLAENVPVDHHDRVRSQNAVRGPAAGHRKRFFPRQPLGTIARQLALANSFLDISSLHNKRNPRVAQKFLPAWRRGSENNHAI
jgi:hypothetical protein